MYVPSMKLKSNLWCDSCCFMEGFNVISVDQIDLIEDCQYCQYYCPFIGTYLGHQSTILMIDKLSVSLELSSSLPCVVLFFIPSKKK